MRDDEYEAFVSIRFVPKSARLTGIIREEAASESHRGPHASRQARAELLARLREQRRVMAEKAAATKRVLNEGVTK